MSSVNKAIIVGRDGAPSSDPLIAMRETFIDMVEARDKRIAELTTWRLIETYKKDGKLVLLLIEGGEHVSEDRPAYRTVGSNAFEHDGRDEWDYAGWCWSHDHWTQGRGGEILGWLPLPEINV